MSTPPPFHHLLACPECTAAPTSKNEDRCVRCGAAIRAGGFGTARLLSRSPHGRRDFAEDGSGRRVALKELAFALVPNAQSLDAFEREARLLRELSHPAVPRFVASFQEGQGPKLRLYIAQEFVEGESLLARIQRGPLDEPACRDIARQVLEVLDVLHRRSPKVLHRDIKPANIIL